MVVGLLYANSLTGEFLNYDDWWLVHNAKMSQWLTPRGLWAMFTDFSEKTRMEFGAEFLPLRDLSAAIQYHWFGDRAWMYHIVQLLFFAGACVGFFELMLAAKAPQWTAFLSALVFAFHPIHVESVAWLSGHKDLLSLFFLLWSLTFYAHGRRLVSFALFMFAFASKYHVIVGPLLLPFIDRAVGRPFQIRRSLPFFLYAVLGYFAATMVARTVGYAHLAKGVGLSELFRTFPVLFDVCLHQLVFPLELQVMYPFDWPVTWVDPRIWRGMGALVTLVMLGWWSWLFRPQVALSAAFLMVGVVPMLRAPEAHLLADRYLLIPSIGFAALVGFGLSEIRLRLACRFIATTLLIAYGLLLVAQNRVWKSSVNLWANAAAGQTPVKHATWINYAVVHRNAGDCGKAIYGYQKILKGVSPKAKGNGSHWLNIGSCELQLKRFTAAEASLRKALDIDSTLRGIHRNLAIALLSQGKRGEAKRHFEEAIRIEPNDPDNYFNAALLAMEDRRTADVRVYYKELLKISPADPRIDEIKRYFREARD